LNLLDICMDATYKQKYRFQYGHRNMILYRYFDTVNIKFKGYWHRYILIKDLYWESKYLHVYSWTNFSLTFFKIINDSIFDLYSFIYYRTTKNNVISLLPHWSILLFQTSLIFLNMSKESINKEKKNLGHLSDTYCTNVL
jgi:hypothetical protein